MKSFRIVKGHFNIVALALLIVVVAMLGGCGSSKSVQKDGTVETLPKCHG